MPTVGSFWVSSFSFVGRHDVVALLTFGSAHLSGFVFHLMGMAAFWQGGGRVCLHGPRRRVSVASFCLVAASAWWLSYGCGGYCGWWSSRRVILALVVGGLWWVGCLGVLSSLPVRRECLVHVWRPWVAASALFVLASQVAAAPLWVALFVLASLVAAPLWVALFVFVSSVATAPLWVALFVLASRVAVLSLLVALICSCFAAVFAFSGWLWYLLCLIYPSRYVVVSVVSLVRSLGHYMGIYFWFAPRFSPSRCLAPLRPLPISSILLSSLSVSTLQRSNSYGFWVLS